MVLYFDCDKWGSVFSVPSSVANEYLKLCDPSYLKVLIYALAQNSHYLDQAEIASACGLSEDIVSDGYKYWCSNGILKGEGENSEQKVIAAPTASVEKPVGQLSAVKAVDPTKSSVSNKLTIRYTNSEILEKTKSDKQLAGLLNEIQSVLGKTINSTEQGEIIALYEYYGFDAPSILLTAEYCCSLEKPRVSYLVTVMKSWYENDILSYKQIEQEMIRAASVRKFENRIVSMFGMSSKPSKAQLEYIRAWKDMGFTAEMIEIAYNKCMDNTSKLNFKYINSILTNWAAKSISTPSQVDEEDSRYHSRKKRSAAKERSSYDLEEFERFARDFDLSKTGRP
ncbi:MAG: DnaD domain protein [Ruminococcus sp.]|nr:DnaD domain protein [Ruminococcus sp.]